MFVREIDCVDAVPALEAGELDLAFVRLEGEIGPDISTLSLAEDRLAVALPKGHALLSQGRIRLNSLAGEQWVMSSRRVSPAYFDSLTSICRAHGFAPRVQHEVCSVTSQIAYVSCAQGLALIPASMRKLAPENVVIRALKEKITVVTAALAWNERRNHPMVDEAVAWMRSRGRPERSAKVVQA